MNSLQQSERNSRLPKDGVLTPICLFFIIFGIQTVVLYRLAVVFEVFSPRGMDIFLHSSWFVAGIPATIYSLVRLKVLLRSSVGDKFLYFLLPTIFMTMMGVGFVNLVK